MESQNQPRMCAEQLERKTVFGALPAYVQRSVTSEAVMSKMIKQDTKQKWQDLSIVGEYRGDWSFWCQGLTSFLYRKSPPNFP